MTAPLPPREPTVAIVVPLTSLSGGQRPVIRRRPGRQRRVEAGAPTVDEEVYHQRVADAVKRGIAEDPVVVAMQGDDPVQVTLAALRAAARESAALLWERERAQREGRPGPEVDKLCARRTRALLAVADLAMAYREACATSHELDPEDTARLIGMIVTKVESTVQDVAPDHAELFMVSLREQMTSAGHPATWGTAKSAP
jgi:hypothetical protein